MITISSNNKNIPVNKVTFSDGAFTFKVEDLPSKPKYVWVVVDPSTPVHLIREEIFLIVDAILSNDDVDFTDTEFKLSLEYTPYARQDRRFEKGNPLPLTDFFCSLRDDLAVFDTIYVNDVHNLAALPKGLNIVERSQLECFKHSLSFDTKKDWDIVVAPDNGAVEKAKTIAKYLGVDCVFANKKRNVSTGKLETMELPDYDFSDKKVLIPDDILDGGMTFISLSKMLVNSGASIVDLYITHMIAAKGLDQFKGSVDKIYMYQTVGDYVSKETIRRFNDGAC